MAVRRGSGKKSIATKDPKKEATFKALTELVEQNGYTVRREKLKRGLGWKVYSGACRSNDQLIIFVDQRLSQDEQINFLQERIRALGLDLSPM
jgi:hypothetical protein